jgi:hypothetical protein
MTSGCTPFNAVDNEMDDPWSLTSAPVSAPKSNPIVRFFGYIWRRASSADFWRHPLVTTIIGAGLLSGTFSLLTLNWNSHIKEREFEGQIRSRKIELVSRTINQGQSSLSVLESYLDIHYWMKDVNQKRALQKDVTAERFRGMTYDKVMDQSISIYALFIQTPKIESLMKDIELTFTSNEKVRARSIMIADIVRSLEKQNSAKEYEAEMKRVRIELDTIVGEMERDIREQK